MIISIQSLAELAQTRPLLAGRGGEPVSATETHVPALRVREARRLPAKHEQALLRWQLRGASLRDLNVAGAGEGVVVQREAGSDPPVCFPLERWASSLPSTATGEVQSVIP